MATEFEDSWDALRRPRLATTYFQDKLDVTAPVDPTRFEATRAWQCAELCRLVYRDDSAGAPLRNDVLLEVGLTESHFFARHGTEAAIIQSSREGNATSGPVFVVFRGTEDLRDWFNNLSVLPIEWPGGGKIHSGFRRVSEAIWGDIDAALDQLEAQETAAHGRLAPRIYCGHSLGGAIATIAASRRPPACTYTFGAPRVGDGAFNRTIGDTPLYRVVNNRDMTPTVPPRRGPTAYRHAGTLHHITRDSRVLVEPSDDALRDDRQQYDPAIPSDPSQWGDWIATKLRSGVATPPRVLADHAPVNYVAHLARFALAEAEAKRLGPGDA